MNDQRQQTELRLIRWSRLDSRVLNAMNGEHEQGFISSRTPRYFKLQELSNTIQEHIEHILMYDLIKPALVKWIQEFYLTLNMGIIKETEVKTLPCLKAIFNEEFPYTMVEFELMDEDWLRCRFIETYLEVSSNIESSKPIFGFKYHR